MEHVQRSFVCTAVERAVQRGNSGGGGGIGIDVRAADAADGVGGAILLVVGVQDEENVEGMFERGIGLITRARGAEEHVQEIAGIAEFVVGINEGHAERMAIGKRRNRGHFADEAVNLQFAGFRVENILGVGIKGGKRGYGGDHHAHGMGVVVKAVHKLLDDFVDEGVVTDAAGPIFQLRGGGKFAVEEEVGGFKVGAFFGEILDGIAAITEDAGIAVDVGDAANAGS